MVASHQMSGATYRARLSDVMRRAQTLEERARREYLALATDHPERTAWLRIERHYATVRGNAYHLLLIHERCARRRRPLHRLGRYLNLL